MALSKKSAMGSPIKKLAKLFFVRRNRGNIYQRFWRKLNPGDRPISDLVSSNRSDETIFLKEIEWNWSRKHFVGDQTPCYACASGVLLRKATDRPPSAFMQVSSWDVPTSQRSHALDRAIQNLKIPSPVVREYEMGFSRIIQIGSPKDCSESADVFMVSEQDLSLLAAEGCWKVKRLYGSKRSLPLSCCLESGVIRANHALPLWATDFDVCQ